MFEDKYIVSWERSSNHFIDEKKYTSVEVELQDDIKMKLQIGNRSNNTEYPMWYVAFDISSNKSIKGQRGGYAYDYEVNIDYDKFKLEPRQITKVRKQINRVVNLDEHLLSVISGNKHRLARKEEQLKKLPDSIKELKKKIQETKDTYAKYFEQSEVA